MGNEIKINKTTGYILVGLLLAIMVGGYIVFGTGPNQQVPGCLQAGTCMKPSNVQGAPTATSSQPNVPAPSGSVQEVYLKATGSGYDKSEITVKKGIPVRLHFTAENAGCGSYLKIYGLNDVHALSQNGQEAIVDFTPTQEGTYQYSCGMRMYPPGNFIVTA